MNEELDKHEDKSQRMQIAKRGGVSGSIGCVDNFLIDKTILVDAVRNRKNLSWTWIEVEKAFDSVSHNWFIRYWLNLRLAINSSE